MLKSSCNGFLIRKVHAVIHSKHFADKAPLMTPKSRRDE